MFLSVHDGINPTVTEQFLLRQPEVVDASVWYTRGCLKAAVTLLEGARLEARSLQSKCRQKLGKNQAPVEITFSYARRLAA
jgi:hypothetical protein